MFYVECNWEAIFATDWGMCFFSEEEKTDKKKLLVFLTKNTKSLKMSYPKVKLENECAKAEMDAFPWLRKKS